MVWIISRFLREQICKETENLKDIIVEKINTVIVIAPRNKETSSAGLTFNMIKKWREDVRQYSQTYATPHQLKKSQSSGSGNGYVYAISTANGLRQLYLLDCMRKL